MRRIKICPECYSANIKEDWKLRGALYECMKCGYRGVLILEMPLDKFKKLKEKHLNKKKESKLQRR